VYTFTSITGTYAEFTLCNETDVLNLHEKVSFSQGAGLGVPYFTAYRALFHRLEVNSRNIKLLHVSICWDIINMLGVAENERNLRGIYEA
jgi:NADPH2:quinone reductase